MTKETLLECINNVDEDLVENVILQADQSKYKKRKVFRYIAAAACLAVIIGASVVFLYAPKEKEIKTAQKETEITESKPVLGGTLPDEIEFSYNNTNYRLVNDVEFAKSNSLPFHITETDAGQCLQNNVEDAKSNIILGDLYKYNNSNDLSILIVQLLDGSYRMAVDEEKY